MRRFLILGLLLLASPAAADIATNAEHAVIMDGDSGQVLWAKDATVAMPPASMSKLMTLELLFQRLKDGRMKLTDQLPISERAWRERAGSECFVPIGARIYAAICDIFQLDSLLSDRVSSSARIGSAAAKRCRRSR